MPDATRSETISHFEGRYLSLREIDDWEFATRPNATGVVGIFAITKDHEVIFVEQYRRPMQARVIEICAGLVGDEEEFLHESLLDCAKRELLEETGYQSPEVSLLMSSPTSAGMTNEKTHLFFARKCERIGKGGGVDGEDIVTHVIPLDEVDDFLSTAQKNGLQIDFKIHACLGALAGWSALQRKTV